MLRKFEYWSHSKLSYKKNTCIGTEKKSTDPIIESDEQQLWNSGVINTESVIGLSYGVFLYNCKLFGMRAGDEHRGLDVQQYEFLKDPVSGRETLRFHHRLCKNMQGSLSMTRTVFLNLFRFPTFESDLL